MDISSTSLPRLRVGVVGLGLIGGSFAKAAARAGHTVIGFDPALDAPALAPFGIATASPEEIARTCELVILALPPRAVVPWVETHAEEFATGAIVVDVAGVKTVVCKALERFAFQNRWTFIGGHPMAGREVNGFAAADATLFNGASMILTPFPSCGRGPLDRLFAFFAELGFGGTVTTTPEHHDRMIAITSQLAHVVSSAYVQDPLARQHAGYSAGSFHDMTRVARLDPDIWRDLFMANQTALTEVLDRLIACLGEYRNAIANGDGATLHSLLAAGRAARLAAAGS